MEKWLRLFPIISKACLTNLQELLEGTNISGSQVPYIMCINQNKGCSQELLVKKLHIDKGCVAKTVKILEEKNLVAKKVCENDKRAFQLFLTSDCDKLIEKLNEDKLKVEEKLTQGMSEDEINTFINLLNKACNNMTDTLKEDENS